MMHQTLRPALLAAILFVPLAACGQANAGPTDKEIAVSIRMNVDPDAMTVTPKGCAAAAGKPGFVCDVRWDRPKYGDWYSMTLRFVKNGMGSWDVAERSNVQTGFF
jgi:curli biogenesis system outer membrane secretion channel CsgG